MKNILFYILIISLFVPILSKAQSNDKYTLLEPLPCVEGIGNCDISKLQTEISINDYVGYVYKFSIALAVFLAVVMIIYGGFEYMLSEALPTKMDAKGRIWKAITGLIMVLASYLILRTIDPRFVQVYTTIPPIPKVTTIYSLTPANDSATEYLNKFNKDNEALDDWQKSQAIAALKPETVQETESLALKNVEIDKKISESEKSIQQLSVDQKIELEKLKQQKKNNESKILIARVNDQANSTFFKMTENTVESREKYDTASIMIDGIINARKNKLNTLGDFTGVQKIEKLGEILKKEIVEEENFNRVTTYFYKDKEKLLDRSKVYKEKLNNIQSGKDVLTAAYGIDIEKYKALLTSRISKIDNILNPPKGK